MVKYSTNVGRCLLSQILHKRNMTASELATKLRMNQSQISDYVNNHKSMSLKNARRVAKALNVNMDDLYDWSKIDE